ncbi:hypothetical protein J5N97_001753 [Dioscorea zingiberensis]|uniref:protein phosphatase methylesterase-1 n=1 Tax=Dioscorea zingiberensis TaxID=325984 RepID=A0A9D5BTI3_9LILI|nr:hypothetical protein J5N97_001753 [Dioscorea zingiberensis]
MDPSNLSALPEDAIDEEPQSLPSAFLPESIPPRPASQTSLQKYSPLEWSSFFDKEEDVAIPGSNDVFHIYSAGSEGPVVFCLHGGGYSGLSFALAASKIKEKARVVAMDLRGHGKSSTSNDLDLSIETLSNDVLAVLKAYVWGFSTFYYPCWPQHGRFCGCTCGCKESCEFARPYCCRCCRGDSRRIIDPYAENSVQQNAIFPTIEKAVEWNVKGGSLRNVDSARVSIPSTLKYDDSKKCYTFRTPLEETEVYWKGWYEGLSDKFCHAQHQSF